METPRPSPRQANREITIAIAAANLAEGLISLARFKKITIALETRKVNLCHPKKPKP